MLKNWRCKKELEEILNTLLVSCVPAIITGIISYLTANKKAKAEIATLQESNKHEIEKLMKQHEVDIAVSYTHLDVYKRQFMQRVN